MAKFRGVVQMYKTFEVEADNQEAAKAKIEEEFKKSGLTGFEKYTVNAPRNLEKVNTPKK